MTDEAEDWAIAPPAAPVPAPGFSPWIDPEATAAALLPEAVAEQEAIAEPEALAEPEPEPAASSPAEPAPMTSAPEPEPEASALVPTPSAPVEGAPKPLAARRGLWPFRRYRDR